MWLSVYAARVNIKWVVIHMGYLTVVWFGGAVRYSQGCCLILILRLLRNFVGRSNCLEGHMHGKLILKFIRSNLVNSLTVSYLILSLLAPTCGFCAVESEHSTLHQ